MNHLRRWCTKWATWLTQPHLEASDDNAGDGRSLPGSKFKRGVNTVIAVKRFKSVLLPPLDEVTVDKEEIAQARKAIRRSYPADKGSRPEAHRKVDQSLIQANRQLGMKKVVGLPRYTKTAQLYKQLRDALRKVVLCDDVDGIISKYLDDERGTKHVRACLLKSRAGAGNLAVRPANTSAEETAEQALDQWLGAQKIPKRRDVDSSKPYKTAGRAKFYRNVFLICWGFSIIGAATLTIPAGPAKGAWNRRAYFWPLVRIWFFGPPSPPSIIVQTRDQVCELNMWKEQDQVQTALVDCSTLATTGIQRFSTAL